MIKITFPDQTVKEFEDGVTPLQVAESISPRFAQDVLVAKVGEEMYDLTRVITADSTIEFFKWDSPEGKHAFWHSCQPFAGDAVVADSMAADGDLRQGHGGERRKE